MDVNELKGAELDFWTAKAEGFAAELKSLYGQSYCRIDVQESCGYVIYEPTQNSKIAGEIAFRRNYTLYPHPMLDGTGVQKTMWLAEAQMNKRFHGMFTDACPRTAICRLRVAEAIAEQSLIGLGTRQPDHIYEARGLSLMTDDQAYQSYLRWRDMAGNQSKGAEPCRN